MALVTYWWAARLWNGLSNMVRWAGKWLAVARAPSFWVRRIWPWSQLRVGLPRNLASLRRKSTNASDPQLKHEVEEHPCRPKTKKQSFPRVKSAESCTQIYKNTRLNCSKKELRPKLQLRWSYTFHLSSSRSSFKPWPSSFGSLLSTCSITTSKDCPTVWQKDSSFLTNSTPSNFSLK